ncbi:MAG: methyltransferase domain-containing protein [Candidatus Udaeobacter sp.]
MKRDINVLFEGAIPENYDRYLGPILFEPFADDIAARLRETQPASLLEIACGSGILTRRLRDTFANTQLVATDLNPGMISHAQRKFRTTEKIEWREADAAALPFSDSLFDAVVCQFGLMFVPEKQLAMREAYRVLRSGGVFLFNVWDSMEQNRFAQIAHTTIGSFFNVDPPTFYDIPFSFYDPALIRDMLERAGFKSIDRSSVSFPCRSKSAAEFAIGLIRGNPTATTIEERGVDVDIVIQAVARELSKHGSDPFADNNLRAFVWCAVHE